MQQTMGNENNSAIMDKCLKKFEVKVEEAWERITKGVQELEHEKDGPMFQFIVKGNRKEGEARAERAVRRTKALVSKTIFDSKKAKTIMFIKIGELERERQKREDELELTIAAEEVELQMSWGKKNMEDEEVQKNGRIDWRGECESYGQYGLFKLDELLLSYLIFIIE